MRKELHNGTLPSLQVRQKSTDISCLFTLLISKDIGGEDFALMALMFTQMYFILPKFFLVLAINVNSLLTPFVQKCPWFMNGPQISPFEHTLHNYRDFRKCLSYPIARRILIYITYF